MNEKEKKRRAQGIRTPLPPDVRHAVPARMEDREYSVEDARLKLRKLKCFNCGYPIGKTLKVIRPKNLSWTGIFCPKCGRRLTVVSSPKPKAP
jgi:hypothetical protein